MKLSVWAFSLPLPVIKNNSQHFIERKVEKALWDVYILVVLKQGLWQSSLNVENKHNFKYKTMTNNIANIAFR